MSDSAGSQIGAYRIEEEVGRGGMATVFRARQESSGRDVALKVLPTSYLHDPMFRDRFLAEMRVVARLEHLHIVPVYDIGVDRDTPFIAMRLLTGGTAHEFVRAAPRKIARMILQIAEALDFAHSRQVFHRDVKPGNILLDANGNAFLSDFGVAKVVQSGESAASRTATVGTASYMSPEQARGRVPDGRTDQYALAATAFELLIGRPPFVAEEPTPTALAMLHLTEPLPRLRDLGVEVRDPDRLQAIFERGMAKLPEDRYPTVLAFARDLAGWAERAEHPDDETIARAPETVVRPRREKAPEPARAPSRNESQALPSEGADVRGLARSPEPSPTASSPIRIAVVIAVGLACAIVYLWNDGRVDDGAEPDEIAAEVSGEAPPPPVPIDMVAVPAGLYVAGCDRESDSECTSSEMPRREESLPAFSIDRTEVMLADYRACVAAGGCSPPGAAEGCHPATEQNGRLPVNCVDWGQANAYCAWRGARLPTEWEWEKAARGTDGRKYPWGNQAAACTVANLDGCEDGVEAVGSRLAGASPYGALDMAGNLFEWTEDRLGEGHSIRGGAWTVGASFLRASARIQNASHKQTPSLGFRCARSA